MKKLIREKLAAECYINPSRNDELFGSDFGFRHGKAINLEKVSGLQEYFGEGELTALRERVRENFAL